MTNIRRTIFYLQQSLRHDFNNNADLLKILDLLCEFDKNGKLNGETVKSREVCPCLKNMNTELDSEGFPYCKNCNPKEDKPSEAY